MDTNTIAPPSGFELDSAPPPPSGFELDNATSGPPEGFVLDSHVPPPSLDQNRSVLRQAHENRGVGAFLGKVRESLSPLLGPTEDQKLRDSFIDPTSGQPLYKPLGSEVEKQGLIPSLSQPFIKIPRLQHEADDTKATSIAKGALNTGIGFVEFAESPLGLATAGAGAVTKTLKTLGETTLAKIIPRAIAGAFAADIASKVPEAARAAGEASVTGNTQEKTEAYLGLAADVLLPAALGKSAATAPKAEVARIAEAGAPLTAKVLEADLADKFYEQVSTAHIPEKIIKFGEGEGETAHGGKLTPGISVERQTPPAGTIAPSSLVESAINEAQGTRIVLPNENISPVELLRRLNSSEQLIIPEERKTKEVLGGKLSSSGNDFFGQETKPGFLRTAEDRLVARSDIEPTRDQPESTGESTQLKTSAEIVREKLRQRDSKAAVEEVLSKPFSIRVKLLDDLLGVNKEATPLSAAERTIFEQEWGRAVENSIKPESGFVSGTKAEAWANDKIKEGQKRLNVGIDPELLSAYAIKGAAIIERGIRDFSGWSKEMVYAYGDQIRPHLSKIYGESSILLSQSKQLPAPNQVNEQRSPPTPQESPKDLQPTRPTGINFTPENGPTNVRKFSERLEQSPDIQQQIRESETYVDEAGNEVKASPNRFYDPISNQETNAKVNARIEERGIDATINDILTDSPELNKLEKVAGSLNIIKRLNEQASQLEGTNKAEADLKRDKAIQLIEKVTEQGTQLGQAVQAFRMWSALGPEGILREYSRNVEKIASNQKKKGFLEKDLAKADPEFQRQILKEGQEIQSKPEGFQRDFATMKLMGKIHRELMKNKSWRDNAGDIAMSWWYASILSSPVTQAVNAIGGINNVLAKSAAQMVTNPKAVPDIIGSLYLGMTKGFPEFAAIMKEGDVTRRPNAILKTQPTLEMLAESGNPALRLLSNAKYVSRLMTAVDMLNFKAAEEMRAHLIAREIAEKEGLSGDALSKRVSEILYNTKEARGKAETQANAEGLKGYNFRRRVNELIEQQRPEDLRDESVQYGLEATYNNKPQGVAGVIADAINAASNRWKPLKLVVPFVNIPANVFNESLNYTPWGYKRYFYGHLTDGSWFDRANKMEGNAAKEQLAKATAGTLAMATLGTLLAQNKDDKNPKFDITAGGPRNPQERYQLMETGWRPYSFKRDGVWYSYLNTPLMVPFAVMGSVGDSMRYNKMDEKDMLTRFQYALWQSGESVLNQSFLSGLRDVLSGAKMSPEYYSKFASRAATSFAVPNAVKWVDRVFDPEVKNANTFMEYFVREVPVARSEMLKPMLNVLGDPVKKEGAARFGSERFLSQEKSDPIWRLIVDNDAYISVPNKNTKLGDRTMNPEEYYDYMKISGQGIKQELEKQLPKLQKMDKEQVQHQIEVITQVHRTIAKEKIRRQAVGNGSLK